MIDLPEPVSGMGQTETTSPEPSFEVAITPWLPRATRLASFLLGSQIDAQDAVQEAVLRAWRRRGNLRADGDVGPWFLAIVANQCRSQRRSRWWGVLRLAEVDHGVDHGTINEDSADQRAVLAEILSRLSYEDRQILILRYYLDWDHRRIAEHLGISVTGARSRLHRALARLKPHFEVEMQDETH